MTCFYDRSPPSYIITSTNFSVQQQNICCKRKKITLPYIHCPIHYSSYSQYNYMQSSERTARIVNLQTSRRKILLYNTNGRRSRTSLPPFTRRDSIYLTPSVSGLSSPVLQFLVQSSPATLVKRSEPHGEWEEDLTQVPQTAQVGGTRRLNQQASLATRTSFCL